MNILFSPIGNTDPWRNNHDGAMLHIVRHYQPKMVYLFFTKSIWNGNATYIGHRNYDWKKIIQSISGTKTKVEILVEDIEFPHDFDGYKDTFHKHIKLIHQDYPDATILLNVTSGTPQMESTLCLEYVTYPNNKICVQVSTPEKGSNASIEYASPNNQFNQLQCVSDLECISKNRCKELNIISFKETIVKNQIKELVAKYDYTSALALYNDEKNILKNKLLRKQLLILNDAIQKYNILPDLDKKYSDEKLKNSLFHCLLLDLYFKRGDYANALIRVKSIAEFLAIEYLNKLYPEMLITDDFVTLNSNYQPFYNQYQERLSKMDKKVNDNVNLAACISILEILDPSYEANEVVKKCLNSVNQVNKERNTIAHRLQSINLQNKLLRNAVNSVWDLFKITFNNEYTQSDLQLFDEYNKRIMELI